MDGFVDWLLGVKAQIILSGALGGVVRWLTLREKTGAGAVSVIVGGICALYLGPVIEPLLDPLISVAKIDQAARASFAGFVIGLTGITISGFVIDFISQRKAALTGKKAKVRENEAQPNGC